MRKYASIILLFIFMFVSGGYQIYFKYLQYDIRQEIKREIRTGLNEMDLTLVVVSSENENKINWIKKNKEFRYKGLMYDVVRIKTKDNKKYYYCINDIKEKNLIANYVRHNKRRNKALLRLRKVLSNKYLPENPSENLKTYKDKIYFAKYRQSYNSIYLEILPPPPKV
ncbi:MAG: hypothetical protein GXO87_00870 [Chlorobi bacterium]|nr:hypothetical protein [Chlorobiota bacterium]